ncbi:Spy/CpxP family protein refolding chaperone [Microvirga sp. TS319]|uniref:Spy/CpxP family protein refolding chaperone n=1 Tax=Microvirga sp. TS319 TaxID=3241165 RepID=UPI00351A7A83
MKKITTLATAAALLVGVGSYAFAQAPAATTPPAAAQDQGRQGRPRLSQDDFNRLVDARVAAIKAGLKLNGDQEKLWAPVETAIRDAAGQRYARMTQFRENREQRRSEDFMQRLEQRSTMQTERAQASTAVAKALRPLWDSFNEDQKRIAPRLLREALNDGIGRQERGGRHGRQGGMMRHHGPMGPGGMGPGPRGPAPQQ